MKPKKALTFAVLGAFLAGIVFMGGIIFASSNYWMGKVQANNAKSSVQTAGSDAGSLPGVGSSTIAEIVDKTGPAVVKIETYASTRSRSNPYFDDPFYRNFSDSLITHLNKRSSRVSVQVLLFQLMAIF